MLTDVIAGIFVTGLFLVYGALLIGLIIWVVRSSLAPGNRKTPKTPMARQGDSLRQRRSSPSDQKSKQGFILTSGS